MKVAEWTIFNVVTLNRFAGTILYFLLCTGHKEKRFTNDSMHICANLEQLITFLFIMILFNSHSNI